MFTLIRNAHVYTPDDCGVQDILLCHDKIIRMGQKLPFSDPACTVVDAAGKTAVPGFLDQHVHVTGGGGEDGFRSRIREIGLPDIISAGVTTVVGLLGTDGTTRSVENLVAKTKALNEEGVTAYCLTGSYEVPSVTLTGSVQKDIAFVQEIIGCKVAISDHRCSAPTREELIRLATQVRIAALLSGKPGVLCMHTGVGRDSLNTVIDIVEHTDIPIQHFRPTHLGRHVEDAVRFARLGGYIDFTSGEDTEKTVRALLSAAEQAPLDRMTLSSDSNGSSPKWNEKKELIGMGVGRMTTLWATVRALITENLLPPEKALCLITRNVAQALQVYPAKGCLAAGSDGDIVLLDGDWQVDTVFARGKCMMRDKQLLEYGYYRYDD